MLQASWGASLTAITCVYILCVISMCYRVDYNDIAIILNKVILMETGKTPSLGPSRCFAHLIPPFALHLANLYEVPLSKCEGDDKAKGLQALFVFLH